jgi:hypothetical protein
LSPEDWTWPEEELSSSDEAVVLSSEVVAADGLVDELLDEALDAAPAWCAAARPANAAVPIAASTATPRVMRLTSRRLKSRRSALVMAACGRSAVIVSMPELDQPGLRSA